MKNIFLSAFAICIISLSCKKETSTPVATTPATTSTTTGLKGCTDPKSINYNTLAVVNDNSCSYTITTNDTASIFYVKGVKYTGFNYNPWGTQGGGYGYYLESQLGSTDCFVHTRYAPSTKAYTCVNAPVNTLGQTQSYIVIDIPDKNGVKTTWASKSGTVNITVSGTKATAVFNGVLFFNTAAITDTTYVYGNIVSQN